MYLFLTRLLALLLLAAPLAAQPVGDLGTLTVGPYQSSATGVLTGRYMPGAKLPTTISYTNTSSQRQDSLAIIMQVLGNGYVQGLQNFSGKPQGVGPYTGQADFGLGDVELPGPGKYLVQVSAFAYDRTAARWVNGPVRVYWLYPLADPLPVGLVSFGAVAVRDTCTLVWETANEANCKGFEVQRSTNGSTWYPRGFVAGHGTTPAAHRYRFNEAQVLVRVYYRLRQVDLDGSEYFSPVVTLAPTPVATGLAKVYPNPARESAKVTAPAGVVVYFYDEAGRQRRQQTLDDTSTLDLRGLPAGSYHLVLGEGTKAARTRLTVF